MRNLIVTGSLLAILLAACSGDKHTGPSSSAFPDLAGIRLGDSPETAKAQMMQMEGVNLMQDSVGLVFSGGAFAGHEIEAWMLDFWQGKYFWYARIVPRQDTSESQSIATDLENKLTEMYGEPERPLSWPFPMTGETTSNSISIFYHPGERVEIWYGGYAYSDSLNRALGE